MWGEIYLFIPKLQRLHRWSLGMDKQFHLTLCQACDYLSMEGLKLNPVSKRGSRGLFYLTNRYQLRFKQVITWHGWVILRGCNYPRPKLDNAFVNLSLRWRHNGRDSISNHHPHHCLLNRSFRRRSKKTSKLCVTGLCVGNSPVTGEFPAQMASNTENFSIWWRHHVLVKDIIDSWSQDKTCKIK